MVQCLVKPFCAFMGEARLLVFLRVCIGMGITRTLLLPVGSVCRYCILQRLRPSVP